MSAATEYDVDTLADLSIRPPCEGLPECLNDATIAIVYHHATPVQDKHSKSRSRLLCDNCIGHAKSEWEGWCPTHCETCLEPLATLEDIIHYEHVL